MSLNVVSGNRYAMFTYCYATLLIVFDFTYYGFSTGVTIFLTGARASAMNFSALNW